jgi:hypothetical protein
MEPRARQSLKLSKAAHARDTTDIPRTEHLAAHAAVMPALPGGEHDLAVVASGGEFVRHPVLLARLRDDNRQPL